MFTHDPSLPRVSRPALLAGRFPFGRLRTIVSKMRTILPETKNPALREKAREIPVADIGGKKIRSLIADMKALLAKEEYGVALAACQVGEPLKLFIVSGRAMARGMRLPAPSEARQAGNSPDEPIRQAHGKPEEYGSPAVSVVEPDEVYINPEFVKIAKKKTEKHEGCLSIRDKWGMVPRAEKASVRAYNENGVRFTRGASGFLAHIFQHEMDHLEGILYTEKATELYDEEPNDEK